ncbi:MAG: MFS transporter, partial [Gammaproteobacteria bacterium]|nr:MFS transporter [Gammaproteobacteria bacterium]
RTAIPMLTRLLGQRRSWMLLAQIGIAAGLLGMGTVDPVQNLFWVAVFALVVAFASATQDIAIDAYRIEAVEHDMQAAMAATYVFGYRIAVLAAGAGALYIADIVSWQAAYTAMVAFVGIGVVTTLVVREPERIQRREIIEFEAQAVAMAARFMHLPGWLHRSSKWFIGAVICPFLDFFARNGVRGLVILALITAYLLSDYIMGVMANPFYLDIGFTKTEIASVAKVYGLFMTIAGAGLGGVLVVRFGIMRILLLGAVMMALANLLFAWMASVDPTLTKLAMVISADNLSAGLANVAFIAYISSLTNTAYTATQYALFSSLMRLPGKFVAGFSGLVVDTAGYIEFFVYAALAGVPAILLVIYLMKAGPVSHIPAAKEPVESK